MVKNLSIALCLVFMATLLGSQPTYALLGLGGGGGGGGLGGLIGGVLGGGGGGGGLGGVIGGSGGGVGLPLGCDPTKLASCVLSILQLGVFQPTQTCCANLASQLSCFCSFDSSLQQLLSSTVGQAITVACGASIPTCT